MERETKQIKPDRGLYEWTQALVCSVLTVVLVILPELAVMAKKAVSQKAKKETGKKQNTQMMI